MILSDDFSLPFGGRLNQDNRLVAMASLIPWAEVEEAYIRSLGDTNQGNDAFPVRLALGSLIIKERLGLSDVETVESITENPYLQFFHRTACLPGQSLFPFLLADVFPEAMIHDLNESNISGRMKPKD